MKNNNTAEVSHQSFDNFENIQTAKLFPRFVSFIVDLAISAFVFFGLLLFTQNVICVNSPYVKNAKEAFISYNIESGLFVESEKKDEYVEKTFDSYLGYQDLFFSYYTDYLVNKCPEEYRLNYNGQEVYWFNVHVLGQKDDRNLYASDLGKLDVLVTSTAPTLFTYKVDADNKPLYDEFAIPRYLNNDPSKELSEAEQKTLTAYFYISDKDNVNNQTCYYHLVIKDLTSRPFVSKAYDTWYDHTYSYPIVICLALSTTIFFLVVPLCFKNGETLGKLMFKLCLANKLGYRYSKIQLIPRFLLSMAVILILYFFVGINLISLGIITFLALGSYTMTIFTKDHKALHDFVAGTIVVDKVHSEIFKNYDEALKFKESINEVTPLQVDLETPRDDTILYKNTRFDDDNKEG